jgi:hypothetical protein
MQSFSVRALTEMPQRSGLRSLFFLLRQSWTTLALVPMVALLVAKVPSKEVFTSLAQRLMVSVIP